MIVKLELLHKGFEIVLINLNNFRKGLYDVKVLNVYGLIYLDLDTDTIDTNKGYLRRLTADSNFLRNHYNLYESWILG